MSDGTRPAAGSHRVPVGGASAILHAAGPPIWSSARLHPAPSEAAGACRRSSSSSAFRDGGASRSSPSTAPAEAIRIAVRVRPFNEQDRRLGFGRACAVSMVSSQLDESSVATSGYTKVQTGDGSYVNFISDMTFWSHDPHSPVHAAQEDVFNELGAPLLRTGLSGYNGCLMAYGQTGAGKSYSVLGNSASPGLLPRLVEGLLQERSVAVGGSTGGSSTGGFDVRIWLSAVEIFCERVRDLFSSVSEAECREEPVIMHHPILGSQVVGAVEVPCLEASHVRPLLDYAARRRAVRAINVGGALSSRSHAFFCVRLDLRQGGRTMNSRLTLVDMAGSERIGHPTKPSAKSTSAFVREGKSINRSLAALACVVRELKEAPSHNAVHFQASKLTLALKEALTGNSRTWFLAAVSPGVESTEETIATLRFAEQVKRLRTSPRPLTGTWAETLNNLQDETFRLRVQVASGFSEPDPTCELVVADRERVLEELHRPRQFHADESVRLVREREQALESVGLLTIDVEEAFNLEQVTPYLLNMSDDPLLAGCLIYFLRRGEETLIGSDPSSTIVINGLSVLPTLCSVVNQDNVRVTLQRPDDSRRLVLLNGQVLQSSSEWGLHHHDRLYLGHAFVLRLHVPMQADVETIDESEEHTGVVPPPPNHELVLCRHPRECLPVLPDRSQSFTELQLYMQHSESFSELQLYMEDLYDKLDADRGHAFFRTLQEACHLIDEANAISRKVRPEDRLHFEVEFVWDIYRDVEDILMIRVMLCGAQPGRDMAGRDIVLHYWTYTKFKERLDLMREVHLIFSHSGSWPGKGDMFEDPWLELGPAELQQRYLMFVLAERRRAANAMDRASATLPLAAQAVSSTGSSGRSHSAAARAYEKRPDGTHSPSKPGVPALVCNAEAHRMRTCPRSFPMKAASGAKVANEASSSSRSSRPSQKVAKPHQSGTAPGPDACAGDGTVNELTAWSRANALPTCPMPLSAGRTTSSTSRDATNVAENERLKDEVACLRRQLEAMQAQTASIPYLHDQMQYQMQYMQSIMASAGGSFTAQGVGAATPGTGSNSIDGVTVDAEADCSAVPSVAPPSPTTGGSGTSGNTRSCEAISSYNMDPGLQPLASGDGPDADHDGSSPNQTPLASYVQPAPKIRAPVVPVVKAPVLSAPSSGMTVRRATPLRTTSSPPRPATVVTAQPTLPRPRSPGQNEISLGRGRSGSGSPSRGSPTRSNRHVGSFTPHADSSAPPIDMARVIRRSSPALSTRSIQSDGSVVVQAISAGQMQLVTSPSAPALPIVRHQASPMSTPQSQSRELRPEATPRVTARSCYRTRQVSS